MSSVSVIIATRNRRELLARCLRSILAGTRVPDEIIVVDNASTDDTLALLERDFPQARLIRNGTNRFATIARNQGIGAATSDYLLLIDDDNEIDVRMTEELCRCLDENPDVGFAGPKMYYDGPERLLLFTGAWIHPITSRATYRGVREADHGQYDQPADTEHIPNIQIVRRSVIDRIGGFDESYRMTFSEADFPMRARQAGFRVLYWPAAKTVHLWLPDAPDGSDALVFRLPMRAYYLARNRILYMRRFSKAWQYALFLTVFLPSLTAYYMYKALQTRDYPGLRAYLHGTAHGCLLALTGRLVDAGDRHANWRSERRGQTA